MDRPGPLRTDDTVLQVAVARLLGYRWPAELDPEMELAAEQRAWVERCAALLPLADKDGIVCIPPVRGELSAADRLVNLLAAAYGEAWSTATLDKLLATVGWRRQDAGKLAARQVLRQHCKLFQHRPFIWHIWDGRSDGFSALVNYHKLDHKPAGDAHLHLPGRLDQAPAAGHRQRRRRRRGAPGRRPGPHRSAWS